MSRKCYACCSLPVVRRVIVCETWASDGFGGERQWIEAWLLTTWLREVSDDAWKWMEMPSTLVEIFQTQNAICSSVVAENSVFQCWSQFAIFDFDISHVLLLRAFNVEVAFHNNCFSAHPSEKFRRGLTACNPCFWPSLSLFLSLFRSRAIAPPTSANCNRHSTLLTQCMPRPIFHTQLPAQLPVFYDKHNTFLTFLSRVVGSWWF